MQDTDCIFQQILVNEPECQLHLYFYGMQSNISIIKNYFIEFLVYLCPCSTGVTSLTTHATSLLRITRNGNRFVFPEINYHDKY